MICTDIMSTNTQIQCKITIAANQEPGKWDLVVVNEDGGQDRLEGAFEVTIDGVPSTQPAVSAPTPTRTPTSDNLQPPNP